jgi:hypothetical protein
MQQLLTIEQNFLNLPQVKDALNLSSIRTLQRTITNGQKKKFEQTLQLSKLVLTAATWFKSPEAKVQLQQEGISWTAEDFSLKVFGWQKSYFYKVAKAGALQDELVETFKTKCDEVEAEGKDANRTLEGLLKYAKKVKTGETTGEGGEGEGEGGEGEGEGAQVEVRVETIFTMSFKREEGNVSVRVDANGVVKTNNSIAEIQEAIAFLQSQLPA